MSLSKRKKAAHLAISELPKIMNQEKLQQLRLDNPFLEQELEKLNNELLNLRDSAGSEDFISIKKAKSKEEFAGEPPPEPKTIKMLKPIVIEGPEEYAAINPALQKIEEELAGLETVDLEKGRIIKKVAVKRPGSSSLESRKLRQEMKLIQKRLKPGTSSIPPQPRMINLFKPAVKEKKKIDPELQAIERLLSGLKKMKVEKSKVITKLSANHMDESSSLENRKLRQEMKSIQDILTPNPSSAPPQPSTLNLYRPPVKERKKMDPELTMIEQLLSKLGQADLKPQKIIKRPAAKHKDESISFENRKLSDEKELIENLLQKKEPLELKISDEEGKKPLINIKFPSRVSKDSSLLYRLQRATIELQKRWKEAEKELQDLELIPSGRLATKLSEIEDEISRIDEFRPAGARVINVSRNSKKFRPFNENSEIKHFPKINIKGSKAKNKTVKKNKESRKFVHENKIFNLELQDISKKIDQLKRNPKLISR